MRKSKARRICRGSHLGSGWSQSAAIADVRRRPEEARVRGLERDRERGRETRGEGVIDADGSPVVLSTRRRRARAARELGGDDTALPSVTPQILEEDNNLIIKDPKF